MERSKISMNGILIVAVIFSAIIFFFTVWMVNMDNPFPVNEFYPIEGTKYAVKYSTFEPNGIYQGVESANSLVLEGSYGVQWGSYRSGDTFYANEYTMTDLGIVNCRVVKIDLNTFQKEILFTDTVLRGACASGELVCVSGVSVESNFPASNSLIKLLAMTSAEMRPEGNGAVVKFIDPATGGILWSVRDENAVSDDFEERYLNVTLQEARK